MRASAPEESVWSGRAARFVVTANQPAAVVQRVDKFHGFFFHAYHQALDFASQKPISDQRGNRDRQPRGRRDERFANSAGQYPRVADSIGGNCIERMNDPRDRTEQTKQRRNRSNGAQRVEEALQFVHHVPAAVLQPFHDQRTRLVAVGKADCQ